MTDTEPTVETEIAQLRLEASFHERGLEFPGETAVETPPGSEDDTDEGSEEVETGSTDEVDAGTDSETDTQDQEVLPELVDEQPESEPEPEPTPLTRAEKKDKALTRSWDNADKRHKEMDRYRDELDGRSAQLVKQESEIKQRLIPAPDDPLPKYSPSEIADSLVEFIDEGDIDTAKSLVVSLAKKADANRNAASDGPNSPGFKQAWDANRAAVVRENPELASVESPLFKNASALLTGAWGEVLNSHPAGVNAAVEVAKLQSAAASVPELTETVEKLRTEISQLKRSTQLDGTGVTRRTANTKSFDSLSVSDQIAQLRREAERRS